MATFAAWQQNVDYDARKDRAPLSELFGEGVLDLSGGALAVSERSAGANMSVDVAAGRCVVDGDEQADQETYLAVFDDSTNLSVASADPDNPRKDRVIVRVEDSAVSGSSDGPVREVLTGTAEASPSAPAVPDSAISLAILDVAAGTASITDANITDDRSGGSAPLDHEARHRPGSGTDALFVSVADEASLPAAGTQGRLAIARNGDGIYYDDGTNWINLGGGGGSMEVIDSVGPTDLADTATLTLTVPLLAGYSDLYLEVSGRSSSSTVSHSLDLSALNNVALFVEGTWLTASAGESLITSSGGGSDLATATFPLNLKKNRTPQAESSVEVTIQSNGDATPDTEMRLLGVPNP